MVWNIRVVQEYDATRRPRFVCQTPARVVTARRRSCSSPALRTCQCQLKTRGGAARCLGACRRTPASCCEE
jgi:hypothetical protein